MPVFLEELNLRSWTGPQGCPYCSTCWFNPYGRRFCWRKKSRTEEKHLHWAPLTVLLYADREREDTFFSLPWGQAWDLKDAMGSRILADEEGAATITHNSICLKEIGVWLLWNCPNQIGPSDGPQFFPCFWLLWVKAFKPAVAESHVRRMARATIGGFQWEAPQGCCSVLGFLLFVVDVLLFIWGFFSFIFLFLQGWFLECAVPQSSEDH